MSGWDASLIVAYKACISGSYSFIRNWRLGLPLELNSKGFEGEETMIICKVGLSMRQLHYKKEYHLFE